MSRFGTGPGAPRRWAAVTAGVALLLAAPYAAGRLPSGRADVLPVVLLARVRNSGSVPHSGYAESTARIGLPSVPQIGEVLDLLGQTTRLRVWWAGIASWRVDALGAAGERDLYRDAAGLTLWDSAERRATRQQGESSVRLARPSDLLPTELGRRLAASAAAQELSGLPSRQVAGVTAAGLRITPASATTTIGRIDMWVDPPTGLPLRVEVTEKGASVSTVVTGFLELSRQPPAPEQVRYRPAPDVPLDYVQAPDIAALVGTFSSLVLPSNAAGTARRGSVGEAGGTYGEGYSAVAALVLPGRLLRRVRRGLAEALPPEVRPYGEVTVLRAPLLSGLLVVPPGEPGYGFILSGAVSTEELERVAAGLVSQGVEAA